MTRITSFTLLIVLTIMLSPLAADTAAAGKVVRVGIFQNAPIVYQDQRGEPEGLYIDLITHIAEREGWDLQYVLDKWESLLQRTARGDIDLVTSITRTPSREALLDFSKEPVMSIWGQLYANANIPITTMSDLNGETVAVLSRGVNGINFKRQCEAAGVQCSYISKASYDEVMATVQTGQAAAGVVNNLKGLHLEKNTI